MVLTATLVDEIVQHWRITPLLVLLVLLGLSVGACNTSKEPAPQSMPSSPPPPISPPDSVMTTAASLMTSGISTDTGGCGDAAPIDSGKPVSVALQDPGGNGEYSFAPGEYAFKVGDVINFEMTSETEFHTFTVPDLGIDRCLGAGETVVYGFSFDKAGTFNLVCIPHEALGMVGTITVKP